MASGHNKLCWLLAANSLSISFQILFHMDTMNCIGFLLQKLFLSGEYGHYNCRLCVGAKVTGTAAATVADATDTSFTPPPPPG